MSRKIEEMFNNLPGFAYRSKVLPDLAPDGWHMYRLEVASRGCSALLGISPEEMVRHGWNTIERMTHPEDYARARAEARAALEAGRPYELQYRMRLPSGEIKWVWEQSQGVYGPAGGLLFLEGLLMDISEQKKRELALAEENRLLRDGAGNVAGFGGLVGQSSLMRRVFEKLRVAAAGNANVILYGETGTGKDMAAQIIHALAGRGGAFIPVNCGAVAESLLESEFFGHVKGAFSGAYAGREGYLAAADGGTLFLDEVGELPLPMQVKLLRALENRTYTPVGGQTPRRSSFKLIAATHRDLARLVREGRMRADFYHRIHVISITMPPLRERMDDLAPLIGAWMENKGLVRALSPRAKTVMEGHSWPGNVRELYNFLERYQAFGESVCESLGEEYAVEEGKAPAAPRIPGRETPQATPAPGPAVEEGATPAPLQAQLQRAEERIIRTALEQCRWRQSESAARLGLSLRTLQRRMKSLGIVR